MGTRPRNQKAASAVPREILEDRATELAIRARYEALSGLSSQALEGYRALEAHRARFARNDSKEIIKEMIALRNQIDRELGAPYAILLHPRSSWRRRRKAAREIAATMPTKIADRKAYYALKEEQGQRWLRERIFIPALLEAARNRDQPQYVRIGTQWVTDASGRKALVRPARWDSIPLFRHWLISKAWAIAAKKLRLGRRLEPLTEKQRDTILLLAKSQSMTPGALRKRVARAAAKLRKSWQRGRPA